MSGARRYRRSPRLERKGEAACQSEEGQRPKRAARCASEQTATDCRITRTRWRRRPSVCPLSRQSRHDGCTAKCPLMIQSGLSPLRSAICEMRNGGRIKSVNAPEAFRALSSEGFHGHFYGNGAPAKSMGNLTCCACWVWFTGSSSARYCSR